MDKKTVQYKRTLRGSVGAGVGALFNGNGRRYYILEHKDASKYHKAGESQKIIIDQVELGREGNCQVRFDESFPTVSRRHAAIIKDGDRWKLVQLSKTNSTFLNGRPVETEWYLNNGDEIQLSIGGPRMGFIVPAGKQSLVSSIKMTERLDLFRKQALAPYKKAIIALLVLIVFLGSASGYVIHTQGKDIESLLAKTEIQSKLFGDAKKKWIADSLEMMNRIKKIKPVNKKVIIRPDYGRDIADVMDKVKPSVYAVLTSVYIANSSENQLVGQSQGTGFLLEDGRFVTARHCVEPWMFDVGDMQTAFALSRASKGAIKIYTKIFAINSKGEQLSFSSDNFKVDRSYDTPYDVPYELDGMQTVLPGSIAFGTKASLGNDWAYVRISKRGAIKDGAAMSNTLKGGTTVHLLGFPKSLGISDGTKIVDPIYNSMSVSRDGLNDGRCIMVSQGVDKGNSGGPVFVVKNGVVYVIGIVSRGDSKSNLYNHLVPMSNLR